MANKPIRAAALLSVTGVLGAAWGVGSGAVSRSGQASPEQAPAMAVAAESQPTTHSDRFIVTVDSSDNVPAQQRHDLYSREAKAQDVSVTGTRSMSMGSEVVQLNKPLSEADAAAFMSSLHKEKGVARVVVDRVMKATADTPNDPDFGQQWDLADSNTGMNVPSARQKSTGSGATVGVIDTGITKHPDLDANVSGGYDFVSDAKVARDNDGRDADPTDPGDYSDASCGGSGEGKSSWHGTHVSGTIAAATNNGTGVAGVAGDAKVEPLRALGACGAGHSSDIVDAMLWGAGESVPGLPANPNPVSVENLSLGGAGQCDPTYQSAIDKVRAKGVTVVVAAGNESTDVSNSSPANCKGVVAVASCDKAGAKSSFSNYGSGITVTAPGTDILSTINQGQTTTGEPGYGTLSGTSMASPHVAGVVALMKAADPSLSPDQVAEKLKSTARPMPGDCSQGCGAGLVDAAAAVGAGGGNPSPTSSAPSSPAPTASPTSGTPSTPAPTGTSSSPAPAGSPTSGTPSTPAPTGTGTPSTSTPAPTGSPTSGTATASPTATSGGSNGRVTANDR